ncbi:iron complex transport system ATP-binding protein [Paucimonas lemoignei]|uniref:Iron complex transport system ATP-binding protein n=1 Tax=Paucimonas lemoignei TaxID=29443 RepID=A0A4R3HQF9_PAULE|nr:ABC transporter ATP-binding protein [Paucimonas lemoignei]TCS33997.1 iron complex transport system ATP-binding protein [Paucimonas lemoignei]
MALISVRNLHVGERIADVSFALERGDMLGVIGPNGAGKSTLLKSLAGILDYRGEIDFDGHAVDAMSPRQRAQGIGLLPQSGESAWSLNVEDVVALGRLPWGDQDAEAIRVAVNQAGVNELLGRKVDQLSGGERARVWLARVLAGHPKLLLADEPIASLDLYYQRSVMEVLRLYANAGQGVILAIHDLALAARYCDKLCLLHHGRVHAWGTPDKVLTDANLSEVFRIPVHVDLQASPPVVSPR